VAFADNTGRLSDSLDVVDILPILPVPGGSVQAVRAGGCILARCATKLPGSRCAVRRSGILDPVPSLELENGRSPALDIGRCRVCHFVWNFRRIPSDLGGWEVRLRRRRAGKSVGRGGGGRIFVAYCHLVAETDGGFALTLAAVGPSRLDRFSFNRRFAS